MTFFIVQETHVQGTGRKETEKPGAYQIANSMMSVFEPQHDKTNKVTVRPAKTQISLGIRPV